MQFGDKIGLMKTHITILTLISLMVLFTTNSCSTSKSLPSAEVNYISGIDGNITMRAIGTGKSEGEAISDAIFNAFDVLFFRGLPQSEQKNALVGINENEERAKQKDYFDVFYKSRYKTFITSSFPSSDLIKYSGGKKSIAIDVTINLVALRKDLEAHNIIRKFGL